MTAPAEHPDLLALLAMVDELDAFIDQEADG